MVIEELIPGLNLENDTIEFKEILAEGPRKDDPSKRLEEGWLKEMVAFANTKGGTMIVGVVDATHEIKPFDNRTLDKIVLMVHRLVKQHIGDDIKYHISTLAIPGAAPSTYIIRIEVEKAENPPVTLKFGGVPSVYVRHFGLTSPATGEEIRDLVLNSESISFDQPFTEEDFDKTQFTLLYNECRKARGSVPTVKELMSIGFVSTEGKLAKGAILFKDGYSSEKTLVECTQFLGVSKGDNVFYASKTIKGNLLEEFKDIQYFVLNRSANGFVKKGEGQAPLLSYPVRAMNEGIINALAHRNYYLNGSQIEINLFKDRLEIVSPGSLPGSKYLKKEKDLASIPPIRRNEVISAVFAMLKLMEKKGSGFDKIIEDYRPYGAAYAPYASSSSNYFALTLPNLAFKGGPVNDNPHPDVTVNGDLPGKNDLKILSYCYNEAKTISEIASFLGVSPSTYFRVNVIERLCKAGYLVENKKTRNSTYTSNHDRVFPQASPSDL